MSKSFTQIVSTLVDALVTQPGTLTPEQRRAVFDHAAATGGSQRDSGELPDALVGFVDKVALHAYKTTDEDMQALSIAGYSEDQIFEITLGAATGAAWARLDRGLAVLHGRQP